MKEVNGINLENIHTPAYLLDERLLVKNLDLLKRVEDETGAKILLAQKGFSMFHVYPIISKYLAGTTASSFYEAKLGAEEFGGETHIFEPAYSDEDIDQILEVADSIVFNSIAQLGKYKEKALAAGCEVGLRVNPEYAEVEKDFYNPCIPGSRFGVTRAVLDAGLAANPDLLDGVSGIHFHCMCEQNSDTLDHVLDHVEEKFAEYFSMDSIKWINFGGGHHITRPDYDIELLEKCIKRMADKYHAQIYLEPGEAVGLNTGFMITKITDIREPVEVGDGLIVRPAILDASAACHMPDVLEVPYKPEIIGAKEPGQAAYTYRFGGNTCLAGDIIGDYSWDHELNIGDIIVMTDMAHYSMVKNNTFNGLRLPDILSYNNTDGIKIVRSFGYEDFKNRLS